MTTKTCQALEVLQRSRAREIQVFAREVARIKQDLTASAQLLSKLIDFQQEYRENTGLNTSQLPIRYLDQQLFMQRLEENVQLVHRRLTDMQLQEAKANGALQQLIRESDSLTTFIEKISTDELKRQHFAEQALCDEQGRIVSMNSSRKLTLL